LQSDERSRTDVSNYRQQRRRDRMEERSVYNVGHRRTGVFA